MIIKRWPFCVHPRCIARSRSPAGVLRELTAGDVRDALDTLSTSHSTRYLQLGRAALARAIKYAEAHDRVGRNVATLVDIPKGREGRPSRSFTLDQARGTCQPE
jgi:hypothetical protein